MVDPFFDTCLCAKRLKTEYDKHNRLIIAVDFDDTVYDFHGFGREFDAVVDLLKRCKKLGFYVVAFTASDPTRYGFIERHFASVGIELDSINKNPIDLPYGKFGKIYYNILLDDRAGLYQAYTILDIVVSQVEQEVEWSKE